MKRFSCSEGQFGNLRTIILQDNNSGSNVVIALKGAAVLSYHIPSDSGFINIIDGYASPDELNEQSGARSCIMAPFSNRIENGFYVFNDEQHQMFNPVNPQREPIHGFVRILDFVIKESLASDDKIELTLYTDKIRKDSFRGYPFDLDVSVKYTLTQNKLLVSITGTNVGDTPLPFGTGWHPYFKTCENGIDHLLLTVPARKIVAVDDNLIPFKGDDAFISVDENPEADFRPELDKNERIIGDREVNYCYYDLYAEKNEKLIKTSIKDPDNKLKITVFQKEGVVYAFSGDGVKHRPRKSIALEPVQFVTNAYNRHELTDKLTLLPGNSKSFDFGVEYQFENK
ncbi:MAG: aldose 1-epimerase [Bacillota bacterium]